MSQNKLKLNAYKTEVLVMGTPQMRAKISIPSITINGVIVPVLNEPVGNQGAVFDPNIFFVFEELWIIHSSFILIRT